MISPIDRWTSKPNIAEKVTPIGGTSIAGGANAVIPVLTDIPCGFAKQIEVFFLCTTANIQHVLITNYAASRSLNVQTQLTGLIVANTTVSVVFNGPFGQSFDISVQLTGAGAPVGTVATIWACAKA